MAFSNKLINNLLPRNELAGVLDPLIDISELNTAFETKVRPVLTASITYYVRKDGSDANTGLINASSGAFLTIQHAVDIASHFDFNENKNFSITIQIDTGTYNESIRLIPLINAFILTEQYLRAIKIVGNEANPGLVIIKPIGDWGAFFATGASSCYTLKGLTIDLSLADNWAAGIICGHGASLYVQGLKFILANNNYGIWIYGKSNLRYFSTGDCEVSGNSNTFISVGEGSSIDFEPNRLVFNSPASFSNAFVEADGNSIIAYYVNQTVGTVTGIRFKAAANSSIATWGSGLNHIAGSIAGSLINNATYS